MTDRATGARPQREKLLLSRTRGFSLIELMMSVVLLAISAALALPSYRDMVEKRQLTNGAEQLAAFINEAQGMAMKTSRIVTVSWSYTDENEWCVGAIASDQACNCTQTNTAATNYCQIGSRAFIMDDSATGGRGHLHGIGGDGAYSFDPTRGLFVNTNDTLTMDLRSVSEEFRLNLVVNSSGRVSLCSDSDTYAVPGYKTCATGGDVPPPASPSGETAI